MNDNEKAVFVKSLVDYLNYLMQNPDSLLARIYGIFTVNMEDLTPVHILLMSNAAQTGKEIENVFDLKGSIINRHVKIDSKIQPSSTLKDVNLLNLTKENHLLMFRKEDKSAIMSKVQKDIHFLQEHNLMDYSLLVIIETNPAFIEASKKRLLKKKSTITYSNENLLTSPTFSKKTTLLAGYDR